MKRTSFSTSVSLAFLIGCSGIAAAAGNVVRYDAQPGGSKIKLEGTSTIHDWTMEGTLVGGYLEVDAAFPASAVTNAQFAKPVIQAIIPIRAIKSSSKKMDEVMQEHMKATEFPRIEYRLIELKPKTTTVTAGASQFDATGALTIAGTTRTNTMPVTMEKLADGKLKVVGSTPVKMSDYGVQPPAPSILGMPVIKTGDEVKISFEWLTVPKVN